MIGVSAWVMLLATLRDRAALMMSFVLPPILFAVFAAIFAGASGADLKLKVGIIDNARTPNSARLVQALEADQNFRFIVLGSGDESSLADYVRRGMAEAGLLIRGDPQRRPDEGPPPLLVVQDAAKPLAATIVIGQVQRTFNEKLPDVALSRILADVEASGAIGKDERAFLDNAFREQAAERKDGGFSFARIMERTIAQKEDGARNGNVLYYAGAVVAVFLLFAAVHGGLTLLDERRNGIAERLALTPGGVAAMVTGKFGFLTLQGALQAGIVFLAAWLLYGASFRADRLGPWLVSCLLAAASAAALALCVCALCRNRKQAETLTTFAVLLVSAIGGSMVPRYLMPPWFQAIGWATPNAWVIRAFELAVQPAAGVSELALPWSVLAAITLAGLVVAIWLSGRRSAY